jgi:hypothetical protein
MTHDFPFSNHGRNSRRSGGTLIVLLEQITILLKEKVACCYRSFTRIGKLTENEPTWSLTDMIGPSEEESEGA